MENFILIPIPFEQLEKTIEKAVNKAVNEAIKKTNNLNSTVYSINQAKKILKIGDPKIKQLIAAGLIKTTKDGKKISAYELNEYLRVSDYGQ